MIRCSVTARSGRFDLVVLEFNNIGLACKELARPTLTNNVIVRNFASGVVIEQANPILYNNIIAFNKNNGIWCDRISGIECKHNCVGKNVDGNFLGCDPELGIIKRVNANKDSVDAFFNIIEDPIFAGSSADSAAVEFDIDQPTDKS